VALRTFHLGVKLFIFTKAALAERMLEDVAIS
jgi:hypothetical protein